MRVKQVLLFITTIVVLFSSCKSWEDISVSGVEKSRITRLNKEGIEAQFDVKIKNPNAVGFNIYKTTLNITLNGTPIGTASITKKVKIKAKSEQAHTFDVKTKFSDLTNSGGVMGLLSLALSKNVDVKMEGNIKAGKWFYRKKFPVNSNQKVPLFN